MRSVPGHVAAALTALATAGLVAGAVGTAAASEADHSSADRAVGSAVMPFPTPAGPDRDRLTVSAHSDPLGGQPGGHVRDQAGPVEPFTVAGEVTCLRVEGNRAAIKYRFDQATGSAKPLQGGGVEVFIEDNGRPNDGQPVDRAAFGPPMPKGAFDATSSVCDDPNTAPYRPVQSGDYTVRDGDVGPGPDPR